MKEILSELSSRAHSAPLIGVIAPKELKIRRFVESSSEALKIAKYLY